MEDTRLDTPHAWQEAVTQQLVEELSAQADPEVRAFWTRYLKGQAAFRGVPMNGVRRIVRMLWREHTLSARDTDSLVTLAVNWLASTLTEDRLAGVLLLAEYLAPRLENHHLGALAAPLASGDLADWNIVDWYATKAVHAFLTVRPDETEHRTRTVLHWAQSDRLWQRRAAVVAVVKLAPAPPFDGFVPLVLEACTANLASSDRFAHTGPGWLMRELSQAAPEAVTAFVEAHPQLSAEARRMALARLRGGPYRRR